MGEERDTLERLSAVEVQVKEIHKMQEKLDQLYNLIMDMKVDSANSKNTLVTKTECVACRKDIEHRMEIVEEGRKKLFWAAISSGLVFGVWLIEQLLNIQVKIGG